MFANSKSYGMLILMEQFSEISILKTDSLDGIECKSAIFLNKEFPTHFHNNWSITLIHEGSEFDKIINHQFVINTNTIIFTPPFVPHSTLGLTNSYWHYSSIYVNIDFVKFLFQINNADYNYLAEKPYLILKDYHTLSLMKNIIHELQSGFDVELSLKCLFSNLISEYLQNDRFCVDKKIKIDYLEDIKNMITENFNIKISLDDLCRQHKTNKYNILRQFKKYTGLTPWEYSISLKLEYSKKMILDCPSLSDLAFESGFYDLSHFNKYFKKYLGVSPSVYKQNLQYFTSR